MQNLESRGSGLPNCEPLTLEPVTYEKAGIQINVATRWIPAFVGMTETCGANRSDSVKIDGFYRIRRIVLPVYGRRRFFVSADADRSISVSFFFDQEFAVHFLQTPHWPLIMPCLHLS